ncbi:hypothetical protein AB1Y20_020433 [Prymnesium parvum]|uniref:Uncharacterized protein n=1 Tax=Prymnesium parvum TaxID=97485 RepID=A0AB34JZA8_PRYPA
MSIFKACLFLWRFAPVICQALTLNGFQTPNCGTFFFSPSPENVTSAFVWLDYPLAAPIIGGYVPDGAFKEAVSDPGSWCNPALWWPLSAEETRSRGLILVTTEMGVSGCQYFGNSNSIFYNARNLGFKAFVLLSVASGYTCSTGLVFNSSFPSAAYKERMSVCSDTPLYIVPTAAGNRYNQQYDTVGYLALLVPSFLEILRGAAASFPTLTVAPYECDVTKVANSPGMFVFTFFLLLFRAIIFVKAVLTLHTLARLRRPVAWLGVLFAGVLTGVASAFEIMGNPVDLPGINYWPVFGQKDQVIVVYLPMCLSLCSNIAFMWLWLKVGLNLRSLMHSKWYDGIGIVLACIPLPILIPFMSSGTFDLYSYETSLIRVVVDQVLAGKGLQDLIKLADDASQERSRFTPHPHRLSNGKDTKGISNVEEAGCFGFGPDIVLDQ